MRIVRRFRKHSLLLQNYLRDPQTQCCKKRNKKRTEEKARKKTAGFKIPYNMTLKCVSVRISYPNCTTEAVNFEWHARNLEVNGVAVGLQRNPVATDKAKPSDTSQISLVSLGLKTWQDGDSEVFCCYHLWWNLMSASELAGRKRL